MEKHIYSLSSSSVLWVSTIPKNPTVIIFSDTKFNQIDPLIAYHLLTFKKKMNDIFFNNLFTVLNFFFSIYINTFSFSCIYLMEIKLYGLYLILDGLGHSKT